jgi:hypothetical protein
MEDVTFMFEVKVIEVIDLTGPLYNEGVAAVVMGSWECEHETHYLVKDVCTTHDGLNAFYVIKVPKEYEI